MLKKNNNTTNETKQTTKNTNQNTKNTKTQQNTPQPKTNTQKSLNILQWNKGNARFLNRKDDIRVMIEDHQPHIFGICEANLHHNAHLTSMHIPNYKIEVDNLASQGYRSQIVLYISTSVSYKRRNDLEIPLCAMVWIEFHPNDGPPYLLCTGYREWQDQVTKSDDCRSIPNQNDRLAKMTKTWEIASREDKAIIIMGDWNVDTLPLTSSLKPTSHHEAMKFY